MLDLDCVLCESEIVIVKLKKYCKYSFIKISDCELLFDSELIVFVIPNKRMYLKGLCHQFFYLGFMCSFKH